MDIWITISIFMGLGIMLAGCAAVLQEKLFVNYYVGIIVSSVIVLIALFKGERGVLGINSILIPMALPISVLGFGNLIGHFYPVFGYVGALIILAVLYKQIKQSCKILK